MFRSIRLISLTLVSLSLFVSNYALSANEKLTVPKLIQANYEVTKNGQPFAKMKEQFTVTGNTYKIESISKGVGVYALFGERKLTSTGEITADGLKPMHFELHQGDNAKKSLFTDFDWPNKTLQMKVKNNIKEAGLVPGVQDLASYPYQFMFMPNALKDAVTVTLTTGKKLNQYPYKISNGQETIESAGVQYKTLHLVPAESQTETKELWLGIEQHFLPVRIMLVDENGEKLEQTLTELHVE
ncbi:MAG TPA: DUF3108 domain-containing protein [Methylotenera sp.]|nr:DUF3108 domain-containing protein [Methylotenera sp.]